MATPVWLDVVDDQGMEIDMAFGSDFTRLRRVGIASLAVASGLAAVASPLIAQQGAGRDVVITVRTVKALDKLDAYSKADFFAQVTIAGGAPVASPVVKQAQQIAPNWVLSKRVPQGVHNVRIEIFDKDLTKNEAIDINRLPNKRPLDFTVNTRNCAIGGFAQGYRCGDVIVRAGAEPKSAEIAFSVEVR
jgi:hypothetical protein